MNNIWLVTQREYMTKVKNKTFLLATFLTPIGVILFFALLGFVMSRGSDDLKRISVIDSSTLVGEMEDSGNLDFTISSESLESLKKRYENDELDGILVINPIDDPTQKEYAATYYSDDQLAFDEEQKIERILRKDVRKYKFEALNIDESLVESMETRVSINPKTITSDREVSSMTNKVNGALGMVVGYVLFFVIFLYGVQVMRSVMEEKINRIVEVLISSVKPFELMMGKVLGVGLVGLTQISIWIILLFLGSALVAAIFGPEALSTGPSHTEALEMATVAGVDTDNMLHLIMKELGEINWFKMISLMLFYFIGGYFAYAAMFAAVGSAVGEDINEAQSLTLPIMLPLMLAVYIGFSAMQAPNGSLAVWASIIPITSSIVMPVRLPIDPPFWQIALSIVLLILFVIFFVWLAGRIYRTGILMYGKKASFKELAKWIFYKA